MKKSALPAETKLFTGAAGFISTVLLKYPVTIKLFPPSNVKPFAPSLPLPPALRAHTSEPLSSYFAKNMSSPPAATKFVTPAPGLKSTVPENPPAI